jgi:hypothetical protein
MVVSLSHTTAVSMGGATQGSVTVVHYSFFYGWRCSRQCRCRTLQLYPRMALLTAVSLSHTTAVSTGGAAHSRVIVAHYMIALVPQPFTRAAALPYPKPHRGLLSFDFTNYSLCRQTGIRNVQVVSSLINEEVSTSL